MVVGVGNAPTKSLDERFTVSCNILSATQQLKKNGPLSWILTSRYRVEADAFVHLTDERN
jgi:hypothetical protein